MWLGIRFSRIPRNLVLVWLVRTICLISIQYLIGSSKTLSHFEAKCSRCRGSTLIVSFLFLLLHRFSSSFHFPCSSHSRLTFLSCSRLDFLTSLQIQKIHSTEGARAFGRLHDCERDSTTLYSLRKAAT